MNPTKTTITYAHFEQIDIRVGQIINAEPFPEAQKKAYRLLIDFGPKIGLKKSSAQITQYYTPDQLIGKQIIAVINFPPKQIGKFMSEVLVLGLPDTNGQVVLLTPDQPVPIGGKMF